jgi:hypothetical protein
MDQEKAINYTGITEAWVEKMVIGLNLCPFAKAPFRKGRIRFSLFPGNEVEALMQFFLKELDFLDKTPEEEVETTLIIHPHVLNDFGEYLDVIPLLESLIQSCGLEGIIQLASFHPDYQFAGTEKEAAQNYTNRSPFPMLHLIREDSISRAVDSHPDIDSIPVQNIKKLEEMGVEEIKKMLLSISKDK